MIIDILVGAVLLISAVIAFIRGVIREVLTIFGVAGGLAAAYLAGPFLSVYVAAWLGVREGEEPARLFDILPYDIVAKLLAYGGTFIVVVILLSITSHVLAESAKSIGLGAIDRTLGAAFGLIRGVLVLGVLYLPVYTLMDKAAKEQWFGSSHSYFYLEKTSGFLSTLIPGDTMAKLEEQVQPANSAEGDKPAEKKVDIRETLQGVDLLNQLKEHEGDLKGYDEKFRNQMDKLFEEKAWGQTNGSGHE